MILIRFGQYSEIRIRRKTEKEEKKERSTWNCMTWFHIYLVLIHLFLALVYRRSLSRTLCELGIRSFDFSSVNSFW